MFEKELESYKKKLQNLKKKMRNLTVKWTEINFVILAQTQLTDVSEMKKQFTKAKELIKEMLSILSKENIEGIYEITEETEEFIREVEEWKK